jgi:hypothetical protein
VSETSQESLFGQLNASAAALVQLEELREIVNGIEQAVTDQTRRLEAVEQALEEPNVPGYRPLPAPRWWQLQGEPRTEAVSRLAAWVTQVYQPGYGHLAARLGPCWAQHDLALYVLDILSELHSVLYLRQYRSERVLSGQAEFVLRLLPAAADLLAAEGKGCEHARARVNGALR